MSTAPGWAMLVDDSAGDRDLIIEAFVEAGLAPDHFEVAGDARQALHRLEHALPHLPCLILCDCNLPAQSGVDFCAALRADARFREVPVILMSGMPLPPRTPAIPAPVWVKSPDWHELVAFVREVRASFFDEYGSCRSAVG